MSLLLLPALKIWHASSLSEKFLIGCKSVENIGLAQ